MGIANMTVENNRSLMWGLLDVPLLDWEHGETVKISDAAYRSPNFLELYIGADDVHVTAYRFNERLYATTTPATMVGLLMAWKGNEKDR